VTGQKDLYASAVKDSASHELYIKLVNTSEKAQQLSIDLKNQQVASKATVLTLTSDNLADVNSFEQPEKISPQESHIELKKKSDQY